MSSEVPAELKRIVDEAAGKEHSANGAVMTCLAEVLDRHEQMVLERKARDLETYLTGNSPDWDRAIEQAVRDLRSTSHGAFWRDLNEDLTNPEHRTAYAEASAEIARGESS